MKKFFSMMLALMMVLSLTTIALGEESTGVDCSGGCTDTENHVAAIGTTHYDSLSAALTAANSMSGDVTITLLDDVVENVTVKQIVGRNLTIDGADNNYTGTITIHGNSGYDDDDTLTIKRVNFITDATSGYFIDANSTVEAERYAHNVTIDSCTFTATTANNSVGAARFRQGYDISMTNCTAKDLFVVLWTTSVGPLHVENLTATGCIEGGISSGMESVTVKDSTIKTTGTNGYGIRHDGDGAYTLNVENSTIEAYIPIVVRKATANGYTVNVSGNNTMVADNFSNTHIAVVSNDYKPNPATFTPATSSYTINTSSHTGGTLNTKITNVVADGTPYNTVADAIASGAAKVYLNNGEYTVDLYNISERGPLEIIGQGAGTKLNFSNQQVRLDLFDSLTISNCTIGKMVDKSWGQLVFSSSTTANGTYTISNCIFNGVGSQGIYINQDVPATFNIEGCIFNGDFGKEGAVTIQNNEDVNITLNVNGCAFNNIPKTSHGIFALKEYGGWKLKVDNKVAAVNSAQLADAIANDVAEVHLLPGKYTLPECTFTAPTGKQFKAWSVGGTEYNVGKSITISTPTTITATWTPNTYTVAFDANSGDGTMADMSFTYGTAQNLTANAFTRVGYNFAGWATSADGAVAYANGASVSNLTAENNGEVTLYAVWTKIPPAPVYPSVDTPAFDPDEDVDVEDNTLNDAALAVGGAIENGDVKMEPAAGYTVEEITKLQNEGKLNLVIQKKLSYDTTEKSLIDAAITKVGGSASQVDVVYIDVTPVLMTDDGTVVASITDTEKPLTITLDLSAEMQKAAEEGKFISVIRVHDGKVTFLDSKLNVEKTKITFTSSEFSTYAVVAMDKDPSANTFDAGIAMYGVMAVLAATGSAVIIKKRK